MLHILYILCVLDVVFNLHGALLECQIILVITVIEKLVVYECYVSHVLYQQIWNNFCCI